MAVQWGMLQVLAEIEQATRIAWPAAARFRMEWEHGRPPGLRPVRTAAGWLGGHLVATGERLRAWSVADVPLARPGR
jgi:hypothetical protein